MLPIEPDDSIDYARLEDEIDALIEAGVHGIYSNGTSGEFAAQTEAEFDRISQMLAERCERAGMPFQIGATHMSPLISLERLKRTKGLHPGAFQVILPDWFPVSMAEAEAFFERMTEAADPIGLVLYNPGHAKRKLQPEEYGHLAQRFPSLIGVKVGGGDANWHKAMHDNAGDLAVFVAGHQLATGVQHGARGSYSNVACIHPAAAVRWYELMQSDPARAQAIEQGLQGFINDCIMPYARQGHSDTALDKFLAALGGWASVGTRLRWPYQGIPESEAERVRPQCREVLADFFALAE